MVRFHIEEYLISLLLTVDVLSACTVCLYMSMIRTYYWQFILAEYVIFLNLGLNIDFILYNIYQKKLNTIYRFELREK